MSKAVNNAIYRIKISATLGNIDRVFDYVILTRNIEKTKKQLYNALIKEHYNNIIFKLIDKIEEDDLDYWELIGQNYSIVSCDVFAESRLNGNTTSSYKEYIISNEEIIV